MTLLDPILFCCLLVLCLALSFLFSGMEAGVFALNRLRIRHLMRAGNPAARLLHGYLENPETFLWTILVGNTVVSLSAVGLVVIALHEWLGHRGVWFWLTLAIGVFLFYALCDLLPKMLFQRFPNRLCLRLVRPFQLVHLVLRPLVGLITEISFQVLQLTGGRRFTGRLFANRDELRQLLQETSAGITSEERAMITRVLDLQNVPVRQVTVPMAKVISVAAQMPVGDLLALAREKRVTRFPVLQPDGSRTRVTGIVDVGALLYSAEPDDPRPVSEFVKPAVYLEEHLRLEVALQRLRRSGQPLAIVLGREGAELGIVSMQDILGFVFGEVSL
jgi:CBS domain containing-hemolysin-like protein